MDDMIKDWLKALYEGEIKAENGAIDNERCFEDGSDRKTKKMHLKNIEMHKEYIRVLNGLIDNL